MEEKGRLLLLLHCHLPYIRHPEHEHSLEENWLYEAVTGAYIPLLDVFERLINDGVRFGVTLSLSPTLLEMLDDPLLKKRCLSFIEGLIELSDREVIRTKKDARLISLAKMYRARFKRLRNLYANRYRADLISPLRALRDEGVIEIISTTATHAYLPALSMDKGAVRMQIDAGISNYTKHFGGKPSGMWLPECGYYEGLDSILKESGIGFFFLEGHGILYGSPRPAYGVFMPVRCPSGVVAFGRHAHSSALVWSGEKGYPADPLYRDFYEGIGCGIKYRRITGRTGKKKIYERAIAVRKAKADAADYAGKIKDLTAGISREYNFNPLVVAAFDGELFGHWWFEGPEWLEFLLRKLAGQRAVRTVTASGCLKGTSGGALQRISPSMSSWGGGGYGRTWINEKNDWHIKEAHKAYKIMCELNNAAKNKGAGLQALRLRIRNQAVKQLLLAQASDWAFMLNEGASPLYAARRLIMHMSALKRLHDMSTGGGVDEEFLRKLEQDYPLFPEIGQSPY
jgi:1,4-alpha-glucan branching enzyme